MDAVKAIDVFMCAHFKSYVVLDFGLIIDLVSRSRNTIPVIRKSYPLDGERLFEELKERDAVKRCS